MALQARRAGLCLGAGGLSEQPEPGAGESSGWNGPGGSCSPCASVLALPKPPKHLPGVFSPSVWLTPSNAGRLLQGVCGCLNKPPLSGTFQQEWPWLSLDFP